jgi:hypothetical protein
VIHFKRIKLSVFLAIVSLSLSTLYSYSRTPEAEEKSFYFPSVVLGPLDITPGKIEQRLTPLKSFLERQNKEFAYITKTNEVMFNLPFFSSFYYYVPLSVVKPLDLRVNLAKEESPHLSAEECLEESPNKIEYDLKELKVSSYYTNPRTEFYLEPVYFSYQSDLTTYISPKNRTYSPSCLGGLIPPTNQINAPKFYVLQTNLYARTENFNENNITLLPPFAPLDFSNNQGSFSAHIFKLNSETLSCFNSSNLVYLKKQTAFHRILALPSIKTSIPVFQTSPIKNVIRKPYFNEEAQASLSIEKVYLFPLINYKNLPSGADEIKCKVVNRLAPSLTPSSLKIRKTTFSKSISLELPFVPLSARLPHKKFENISLRPKETEDTSINYEALTHACALKLEKTPSLPHFFSTIPCSLTYKNEPPLVLKKEIPYSLSLEIPNVSPGFSKLLTPQVMTKLVPSKNSIDLTYSKNGDFFLPKLELPEKIQSSGELSLTAFTFPLIPGEGSNLEKPLVFATLNHWSPKQRAQVRNFFALTEKPQTFYSSKEGLTNSLYKEDRSLSLALANGKNFCYNQFYVSEFIPKLLGNEQPIRGDAKLDFSNLSNNILAALISFQTPFISSDSKKFSSVHEVIKVAYLEKSTVTDSAYFPQSICPISLPEIISHKIHPSKSSSILESLVATSPITNASKLIPKEGVFPKKEFLEAGLLTTTTEVKSYPPFLIPYSNAPADLALNSITIPETEVPFSLIQLFPFDTLFMPPIEFNELMVSLLDSKAISGFSFIREDASSINRNNRFLVHNLTELPSLEFLQTYSLSDDFKVDVHVVKKMEKEGYAFSLQLSPYNHDCLDPLPEHIYFILDRSSSIESHRFASFKASLVQALSHIDESATFNIITFDQTCEKLSAEDLKPTKSAIQFMRKSLDKVSQKWSSSFSALIAQIEAIQKQAEELGEPHTVIILSNGHFLKNVRFNRESLYKIFHNQTDNFSLCTAAVSDNNNMPMLELLSKLGRGEFLHSQTHAAFPRKLAVLVKKIQKPIASDISITLADPSQKITFAHNSKTAPLLYCSKPYIIYGQTEKLEDLRFIIQGKSGEKWLNIVKKVNLSKADKGKSIDKELFTKEALGHVLNFIFTNNQSELILAKDLISPFDIRWSL